MLKAGDRIQNCFSRLIGRVVEIESRSAVRPYYYTFSVRFEDDAAAARHYARNGPNGTFLFTNTEPWMKIDDLPVPMEDTRDYLDALMSLRA